MLTSREALGFVHPRYTVVTELFSVFVSLLSIVKKMADPERQHNTRPFVQSRQSSHSLAISTAVNRL